MTRKIEDWTKDKFDKEACCPQCKTNDLESGGGSTSLEIGERNPPALVERMYVCDVCNIRFRYYWKSGTIQPVYIFSNPQGVPA